MSTEYNKTGTTAYTATIPALTDTADITQAFKDYHDDVTSYLDAKAPKANPVFSGTVDLSAATVSLPTGAITTNEILNGTIVDGDISSTAAIAQSKISGLSDSLALKANLSGPALTGSATAVNLQVSGTLTATLTGTATNATNAANFGSGFRKITVLAGATGPANPNTGDVWISY